MKLVRSKILNHLLSDYNNLVIVLGRVSKVVAENIWIQQWMRRMRQRIWQTMTKVFKNLLNSLLEAIVFNNESNKNIFLKKISLSLFVGFIFLFTKSTLFSTMNPTMDSLVLSEHWTVAYKRVIVSLVSRVLTLYHTPFWNLNAQRKKSAKYINIIM